MDTKVIITVVVSGTFLIALGMALMTPKCLDVQLPGGGKINNCAQGYPTKMTPPALTSNATPNRTDKFVNFPPKSPNETSSILNQLNQSVGVIPNNETSLKLIKLFNESSLKLMQLHKQINALSDNYLKQRPRNPDSLQEDTLGDEEIIANMGEGGMNEGASEAYYLQGVWNLTGTSNGYPISGQIKFGDNNTYQVSGKLSNMQKGNVPFYYLGKYNLDNKTNTLTLTTNTGIETTYRLGNIKKDSISASNPTTSEYYTYTRFS